MDRDCGPKVLCEVGSYACNLERKHKGTTTNGQAAALNGSQRYDSRRPSEALRFGRGKTNIVANRSPVAITFLSLKLFSPFADFAWLTHAAHTAHVARRRRIGLTSGE